MGFWKKLKQTVKSWFTPKKQTTTVKATPPTVRTANRGSTFMATDRRQLLDSLRGSNSANNASSARDANQTKVQIAPKLNPYAVKKFTRFQPTFSQTNSLPQTSSQRLRERLDADRQAKQSAGTTTTVKRTTTPSFSHHSTALGTLSKREIATTKERMQKAEAEKKEREERAAKLKAKIDKKYGDSKEARQRIKVGDYASDPDVAKYEVLKHPIASSAARGALSGTTLGLSDLAASKLTKGKAREAEEFYQRNKSKTAEALGEIGGSLATFGLTAGATEKAATKAMSKLAPKATEKVTATLAKRVGKEKAAQIVKAVGTDVAQNLTTGAIYDLANASKEHELGSADWWKEVAKSAAFNAAITGGVAGVSIARGGKQFAKEAAKNADDIKVSLKRKRKTDLVLPNERPKATISKAKISGNEFDIDDALIESATTTEDFMNFFGLDRATAEILAKDKAKSASREIAEREATFNPFDFDVAETRRERLSKGNIKPLAENLRTNKELPRSTSREWRAMPRSAKRVDTSIEGISKQLDELKGRTWETDRERRAIETKINDVTDRLNRAKWRREGGADMNAMQKAYRSEYAGFDMGKTTNSHQSDALEGKLKGKTATVVEMSPDEYIERTYRQIFKKPSERAEAFSRLSETEQNVAKYAEAMQNGEKFPLPYLDYSAAQQEGRHRALAAKRAGIDKIPVVIIDDAANPKAIIDEVAEATAKANVDNAANDFPYAMADDVIPSTNPAQTAKNEVRADLEQRVNDIAERDIPFTNDRGEAVTGEPLKVNKVAEDEVASGGLPSGVRQVRSAYEYNNGEAAKIEDGILTSWNDAWQASKEYSKSHATGEKNRMSKVAVSQLNAMDSNVERELRQKLVESGDLNYDAVSSAELYDKIAKQMRDDPDRWVKDMIEINEGGALDFRSTPEWQARVQYIMGTVDPSADQASEIAYTEAFKLAQNISSKGGQTLNLRRNFVHLTPMGKRDAILDDFINILDKSAGFRKNHPQLNSLGRFDQREYIRGILMDDDGIRDGVENLVKADKMDDVSEAFTELMLNVNKKNPKAGFDVVQELRYLNMLGNPKTHIRNVFGSAFFSPMRQISNAIRSGLEKPVAQYAKRASGGTVEVTRHGGLSLVAAKEAWVKNPTTEAGKAAKEAFEANKAEILGSAKYDTVAYKGRGKTIAGKTLDAISDFNSNLLSGEDDFFRTRAYRESYIKSYNRYLKDGKPITDKIKRQIEKEALSESQIATFNEYNNFAKWLSNITSKANDANASTLARWGGRGVNAVMPFTKVPANLMKQSINYSPLGIAKGFANIKTAAKKGDAELLNRAIDELASGLTGTGIFGLGMLLGKTTHNMFGMETEFTTNAGKNDPAAKFKKDRGMQNYSITFKDPETGKGHSFTLDWLVPTSATFFSGIEMANQMKSGDFDLFDIGGDWSEVMTRLAEPVMETSMLSGLHGMLETMRSGSNDDDTKGAIGILLRETAQSWLNSLVPTAAGQIARTAYKTDMQISGDTDWEYFRNQLKSKAGLANTNILGEPLGADTDAYGNVKGEKTSKEDYVKSGLKNFLSPANIQKVDFSKIDNEKIAEYEQRVKNGEDPNELAYLFPKKQYKKKFSVAGEDVKLSNRDLSTYNQAKTTGGEEGMRYILENIMFNRPVEGADGKKVPADDAYTKEQKAELMNQFKGKSMREVEEWLYAQPQFKKASDAEKKKAINGLWTLTAQGKSNASQRVGEQAVIEAQGGDVNEYNFKNELSEKKREALQPYVDKGVLTYEEAVDFARNAGKTYYYENEDGGTAQTYFNKAQMMEYLMDKGYSYEKAEALFNSFKASNAKPYDGTTSSGRGRRGYRRRGYRRRGHRRSGKATAPKPIPIKQSDYKADKAPSTNATGKVSSSAPKSSSTKITSTANAGSVKTSVARTKGAGKATYKSLAETLEDEERATARRSTKAVKFKTAEASKASAKKRKKSTPKSGTTTTKIAPPTVKFKKYEV